MKIIILFQIIMLYSKNLQFLVAKIFISHRINYVLAKAKINFRLKYKRK